MGFSFRRASFRLGDLVRLTADLQKCFQGQAVRKYGMSASKFLNHGKDTSEISLASGKLRAEKFQPNILFVASGMFYDSYRLRNSIGRTGLVQACITGTLPAARAHLVV